MYRLKKLAIAIRQIAHHLYQHISSMNIRECGNKRTSAHSPESALVVSLSVGTTASHRQSDNMRHFPTVVFDS